MAIHAFVDDFAMSPIAKLNGELIVIPCKPLDIVRGAVTIRRGASAPSWPLWLDRAAMAFEILSIVRGSGPLGLGRGDLEASLLLDHLDATEKARASYRVGMGVAHLLGQELLGLRAVTHVDPLVSTGGITLFKGKRRPDLVGHDLLDGWVVIEAKGRSETPRDDVVEQAKLQAENVDLVTNKRHAKVSPLARVACVTDLSAKPIRAEFVDPPEPDAQAESTSRRTYAVDGPAFLSNYYSSVGDLIEATGQPSSPIPGVPDAFGARLPGTSIWLGLARSVREALTAPPEKRGARVRAALQDWEAIRLGADDETTSIGRDGHVVHLGPTPQH